MFEPSIIPDEEDHEVSKRLHPAHDHAEAVVGIVLDVVFEHGASLAPAEKLETAAPLEPPSQMY